MKTKKEAPTALFRSVETVTRDMRNAGRVAEMLRIVNECDSPEEQVGTVGPFVDEDTAWNMLKKLARSIE